MVTHITRVIAAALSLAALAALAESAQPPSRPDPLDAKASVPPVVYRSSLPMVRAADAETPITWREANDNVTRIGGWRSYARESQAAPISPPAPAPAPAGPASAPAAAAKPADKSVPTAPGHGGHKSP